MLEIRNKTVRYEGVVALEDVTLHVGKGERIAVCGANGSGKSTLLRALLDAALQTPRAKGQAPSTIFVPQDMPTELELSMTAHDYVMLGRTPYLSAWRRPAATDEAAVAAALASVGLADFASRRLNAVSGGERRRLALALALASGAPVLLLDESTAHLDPRCRREIFDLLAKTDRTIVMSIHEFPLPQGVFTRLLFLENGRIGADCAPETFDLDVFGLGTAALSAC